MSARPPAASEPRFVSGSLRGHILSMTGAGALGLMAIFIGDLANLLFLSMLRDVEIVAAIGYASSILFVATSIGIGLSIAATALVAPALGAGDRARARRLAASAHVFSGAVSAVLALALWLAAPRILTLLGAAGRTHALAASYLAILLPFLPPLAVAMTSSGVLRSVGDGRRAMSVTMSGAAVNVALDPILIFALGLGIEGAAIATAVSRFAVLAVGLHGVVRAHDLVARPAATDVIADAPALAFVAAPAVLANVATPVGNAYVTAAIAPYGDAAVAGWAIIGRILPVAFGAIYALSGTVGPILGQNLGARRIDRMREALTESLLVTFAFTMAAWVVLALLAGPLARLFGATAATADLVILYCRWLAPLFLFLGWLFVANAAYNTMRRPHYATALNWGRATLGTVPFVEIGGRMWGAEGVLVGNMAGGIVFGLAAVWGCYRLIDGYALAPEGAGARPGAPPS